MVSACGTVSSRDRPRRHAEPPDAAPRSIAAEPSPPIADPGQVHGPSTFVFACGTYRFVVQVDGDTARVCLPDRSVDLTRAPTGSGSKFTDGEILFWSHGEEAMLQVGDVVHRDCYQDPSRGLWEGAKLAGRDFHAVGDEPKWLLRILDGGGNLGLTLEIPDGTARGTDPLAREYPGERYRFGSVQREFLPRATVYRAREGAHAIEVTLRDEACAISAVGGATLRSVRVRLNDRTFDGCGHSLR
jgi:membrane-bound inhibitor of C-type lysozyme/uncharacterized membrane protein